MAICWKKTSVVNRRQLTMFFINMYPMDTFQRIGKATRQGHPICKCRRTRMIHVSKRNKSDEFLFQML
ncbi:MAG: hypothetical protein JWP81_2875 [Ferruginibacter sp.]|nr:hypothetical protein [Ferruginibacter sp.]